MTRTATATGELDTQPLESLVEQALAEAKRHGATAAEASAGRAQGFSVSVRMGDVETVEHNRDKSLVVTVYVGKATGTASTSDFSPAALRDTVRSACSIARHTAEDPCAGLADPARLAAARVELDLHHRWDISVDAAIAIARRCEDAARAVDPRINNSEGATVSTHDSVEVYGNTHGFLGDNGGTRHSISCAVVGEQDGAMQRDYWYSTARAPSDLEPAEQVGEHAARRTVRRLNARKLATRHCPVLYEAPIASSLISHFIAAVRGSNLYRKASFLLDHLGKPVFADHVRIHEQPHLPRAIGSAWFDHEGVATQPRDIVAGGILAGYVLDTYSGCKLGMDTTGNAGGVRNLTLDPGADGFEGLLRRMDTGLLVTELIGSGVNIVTGDYSRGAAGFWVERGEIAYPVEEITVASTLPGMFRGLVAVGSDVDTRGNIRTGSVLIDNMTVAGD